MCRSDQNLNESCIRKPLNGCHLYLTFSILRNKLCIPGNRHQHQCHVCNVTGLLMVLQGIFCVWVGFKRSALSLVVQNQSCICNVTWLTVMAGFLPFVYVCVCVYVGIKSSVLYFVLQNLIFQNLGIHNAVNQISLDYTHNFFGINSIIQ